MLMMVWAVMVWAVMVWAVMVCLYWQMVGTYQKEIEGDPVVKVRCGEGSVGRYC